MPNSGGRTTERALRARVLWALAAAPVALCATWPKLFLEGQIPVDGNMIALSFPDWSLTRALGAGNLLPAWNPWRDMGEPFLADPQVMAAYPVMRLLCRLPNFTSYFGSWVAVHTLLAAFFMGALAWRMYRCEASAAAAALLAGLNGTFTARVTFPNHFAAAAWLPPILFFQQELSPAGLGVCLALQWFAGFPPFSILSVLAVTAWACGQGRKGLRCLLQAAAWAAGLAAVQFLPFLEFIRQASRKLVLDPAMARQFSVAPAQLLKEAFVPLWSHWSPAISGDPAIVCFYVGTLAWVLAAWAILGGGKREAGLAAGCAAALLLSLGGYLPGFDAMVFLRVFRFPANWLYLAATALALLAAAGVSRLRSPRWRWAAVAIIAVDLLAFAQVPRVAWARPAFLSERPALADAVRGASKLSRVYHTDQLRSVWESGYLETESDFLVMRDFLAPSYGAAFEVSEASSYQTLRLKSANDYLARMTREGPSSQLVDWAGIGMVVGIRRGAVRVDRDSVGVTARTTARERVFLEPRGGGTVRLSSYVPGRIAASVVVERESTIVLSEMNYPGWIVLVDGVPVTTSLFAGAFPSVALSPGSHEVLFVFRSRSVSLGALLSLLTACVLAAAVYQRR